MCKYKCIFISVKGFLKQSNNSYLFELFFSIIFATCLRHNKVRFHLTWQKITVSAFVMFAHIYSQMYAYYLFIFNKNMSEACIPIIRRPTSLCFLYTTWIQPRRE